MARKKLSEFSAKTLLFTSLGLPYSGVSVPSVISIPIQSGEKSQGDLSALPRDDKDASYVVKVDQGIKGRMKKGLVKLKVKDAEIESAVEELAKKGYSQFLVEEFVRHESADERYISLERTREGIVVYFAAIGGIDIEENMDKVKKVVIPYSSVISIPIQSGEKSQGDLSALPRDDKVMKEITNVLGVSPELFQKILQFFQDQYISFLEINPLVINPSATPQDDNKVHILDLAVEVDSTAEFFLHNGWTTKDFAKDTQESTKEEQAIQQLKSKSQAAFTFDLLNADGSICMLLSGGGASIVLADEVYNLGYGKQLANYGEYSGNPNQEETYIYTKNVLALLLTSHAKKKVLIIGGGVANFTDIRETFKGVMRALDEYKKELVLQGVRVFVRRGGPHQVQGLAAMKEFLEKNDLLGVVMGPDSMITNVVSDAIAHIL